MPKGILIHIKVVYHIHEKVTSTRAKILAGRSGKALLPFQSLIEGKQGSRGNNRRPCQDRVYTEPSAISAWVTASVSRAYWGFSSDRSL